MAVIQNGREIIFVPFWASKYTLYFILPVCKV